MLKGNAYTSSLFIIAEKNPATGKKQLNIVHYYTH